MTYAGCDSSSSVGAGKNTKGSANQKAVLGTSLYDPQTWESDGFGWAVRANGGPPPRYGHGMVYDCARGRTVLFGGAIDGPPTAKQTPHSSTFFRDTWEWDGQAWTQMADIGPAPRALHCMAFDSHRGRVVMFGGQHTRDDDLPFTEQFLTDTWEWDGAMWTQVADSGPGHWISAAMAYDASRQQMVLFGGVGQGVNSDVWIWNPAGP